MRVDKALEDLRKHVDEAADKSSYSSSMFEPTLIFMKDDAAPKIAASHALKYISRYLAQNGDKKFNPKDLLKACHYLLMEYERRINN